MQVAALPLPFMEVKACIAGGEVDSLLQAVRLDRGRRRLDHRDPPRLGSRATETIAQDSSTGREAKDAWGDQDAPIVTPTGCGRGA